MKREILCPICRANRRKLFPTDNPYPEEHIRFVDGIAKIGMLCDSCIITISPGDECTAFSGWADYGGIPYYEWEPEYITINEQREINR